MYKSLIISLVSLLVISTYCSWLDLFVKASSLAVLMNFNKCKAAVHGFFLTTLLVSRPGSIPVYRFTEIGLIFHNKYIFSKQLKTFQVKISKMVWNQNISRGTMPQTSLEVENRSVLILDPRLISIHFAIESFLLWYVLFYSKPAQSVCLLARAIWDITYFA